MDRELLWRRAEIIRQVRSFFDDRNYLSVDTPLLSPDLIPESCLEVFETQRIYPPGSRDQGRPYWLIPSPEIWMKKLLAEHPVSMYQICKCFRNGETTGRQHSPEFTMLEYYTTEADYMDSLRLTEELFHRLGAQGDLTPPFEQISVAEAFTRWAGFDLYKAAEDPKAMEAEARRLGLDPPAGLSVPALYDLIFIHAVEGQLPKDTPVALMDYPAFVPTLAKLNPGPSTAGLTAQRWELYVRGIELANCFTEETDPQVVRTFFQQEEAEKKQTALVPHAVDQHYWKIFDSPKGRAFPVCSGVAMGLDRLIMALTGRSSIEGVLPFTMG
ncbi:MAG: LysR family transcriptional regulator [Treponema sp.]|nr:LysR family transcriptional regulator [Treponema sp.]